MKLDIIFAGAARDEQQEGLLLDLLAPLGIDKHTVIGKRWRARWLRLCAAAMWCF